MASETPQKEVVSMELPAPPGWKKQFFPKRGRTPRKSQIVFTAPTGEEIHNQRQLQQYLKAHPGGPPASEFDWGTGETPRRSTRISGKAKAAPLTPESDPPKKRRRSTASKKDNKDDKAAVEEETKTQEVELEGAEKTEDEKKTDEIEKDVRTQESEKTDEVKASEGGDHDFEMQQTQETEKIEPEVTEVEKENENEVKDTTEPKETAFVESKSEGDTTMPDAVVEKQGTAKDNEKAFVEDDKVEEEEQQEHAKPDAEGEPSDANQTEDGKGVNRSEETSHENNLAEDEKPKAEEQPQSDPELQDGLQEHAKPDAEGEPSDANQAEDGKGVNRSEVPSHENNLAEIEKPKAEEQPQSEPELQGGLQEPGKLDTSANVEVKLNVDIAGKDNGNKPGSMEEPKAKDLIEGETGKEAVEVTENGNQAS